MKTRPYMRTKHSYMLTLMELGRYTEAIKQGEELLELCESDNQGVRYLKQEIKFTKTKIDNIENEGTYSWGSEAEAYLVVKDYKYLLEIVPTFIEFVEREIK